MSTQKDSIAILLSNRSYLYKLLQRVFGDEPKRELLEIVTGEHTKESLQLILEENDPKSDDYFDLLTELDQKLKDNAEDLLDKLRSEYTYLMIGPDKLPAPPWESVYTTKERLIFQESTLKVRQAYLKYNFLPANYPHEADDHLALELDFMAHLAELASKHFEEERDEEVRKVLLDQKAFLDEHLLLWIDDFAAQIQQSKTHYFYPQMAMLTGQVLKIDRELIEEILALL